MPNGGETISINKSIIDDSVQSIPMSADWTAGSGAGASLQVTGTGTVILGGTNSYIGSTTVSSGTLSLLNSTLYAGGAGPDSQVTISLGATLKGTGTINSPATVFGTLSPGGNSIGTLHDTGPLTLSAGSVLHIGINSSGTSLVSVVGPASLAGNLQIDLDPSAQPGTYTILSSSAIAGTFHSVAFTGPTPNYKLSYLPVGAPTYVQLDLLALSHLGAANGTGTIFTRNNQASFSFNISDNNRNGTPSGTLTYTDVKGGIKLTSTAITGITLTGNQAYFTGYGTMPNSNPRGRPIPVSFSVTAVDNGTPGAPKDTFLSRSARATAPTET